MGKPSHKKKKTLINYALIRKKISSMNIGLPSVSEYKTIYPPITLESALEFLGKKYPKSKIEDYVNNLNNEAKSNEHICMGYVHSCLFIYVMDVVFPLEFSHDFPTLRRINKMLKDLEWFKGHIKWEGSNITCIEKGIDQVNRLHTFQLAMFIIQNEKNIIERNIKNKKRGQKRKTLQSKSILDLVLYLILDCGCTPDNAYILIAGLVALLKGKKHEKNLRISLRMLATGEAKRILKLKPLPK